MKCRVGQLEKAFELAVGHLVQGPCEYNRVRHGVQTQRQGKLLVFGPAHRHYRYSGRDQLLVEHWLRTIVVVCAALHAGIVRSHDGRKYTSGGRLILFRSRPHRITITHHQRPEFPTTCFANKIRGKNNNRSQLWVEYGKGLPRRQELLNSN